LLLAESTDHWLASRALLVGGRIAGAQVHEARIAALCRQHGVRALWSADRDFNRFADLTVVNPLVGRGSV
jgi:predicted nucleic acid-binding protein